MIALEITVQNINKLAFIYELGSYCIMNEYPVSYGALQEGMDILWDDDYLYEPIKCNPTIKKIIKTQYWENTYVGFHIDSMDTLRATLIQGQDCYSVFIYNNYDNIKFFENKITELVNSKYIENEMKCLFNINKHIISCQNKFQVWWKDGALDCEYTNSQFIVTGELSVLKKIYNTFIKSSPRDIGKYHLFSFNKDTIEWVDI